MISNFVPFCRVAESRKSGRSQCSRLAGQTVEIRVALSLDRLGLCFLRSIILDKLPNFSEPQFFCLKYGIIIPTSYGFC